MAPKKLFHWEHLQQLRKYTKIPDNDHSNMDSIFIYTKLWTLRASWKTCKKQSSQLRQQFLEERAAFYAMKIRSSHEKALRAIIRSEESRKTFASIRDIMGKNKLPLSQVDIPAFVPGGDPYITLTERQEIEHHIMLRN
jgi:actin-related protein